MNFRNPERARIAELLEQLAGTMPTNDIAAQLGKSIGYIKVLAQDLGVSLRVKKYPDLTADEQKIARSLRQDGMPLEELAEKFDTAIHIVRKACTDIQPTRAAKKAYRESRKVAARKLLIYSQLSEVKRMELPR